jgi:hypothetical protein
VCNRCGCGERHARDLCGFARRRGRSGVSRDLRRRARCLGRGSAGPERRDRPCGTGWVHRPHRGSGDGDGRRARRFVGARPRSWGGRRRGGRVGKRRRARRSQRQRAGPQPSGWRARRATDGARRGIRAHRHHGEGRGATRRARRSGGDARRTRVAGARCGRRHGGRSCSRSGCRKGSDRRHRATVREPELARASRAARRTERAVPIAVPADDADFGAFRAQRQPVSTEGSPCSPRSDEAVKLSIETRLRRSVIGCTSSGRRRPTNPWRPRCGRRSSPCSSKRARRRSPGSRRGTSGCRSAGRPDPGPRCAPQA